MRVLIGYAYLTVGGVETVLRARMEGLAAHGIDVDAWFLHDLGGRSVFAGLDHRVRVGGVDELAAALVRHDYDLVVTIDTPELLGPLAEAAGQPRLVVECHSPYLENLGYLAALPRHRPAAVLVPSEHQRRLVEALLGPPLDATAATPCARGAEPPPRRPFRSGRRPACAALSAPPRRALARAHGRPQELARISRARP